MTAKPKRCVICGTTKRVRLWTIDNLNKVVATHLCKEHAAPLWAIMDTAGDLPAAKQIPIPERVVELKNLDVHQRGRRDAPMEPLLNWSPPTEPELHPPAMPPELTDLDLIVIEFREQGMSWEKIGGILDISRQAAQQRFGHLPARIPGGGD